MGHRRNSLDFPPSGLSTVNPDKTCPACDSKRWTVQIDGFQLRDGASPTLALVECYACRIGFVWTCAS